MPDGASTNPKLLDPIYEVVGEASWTSWGTAMLVKHMTWRSLAARYRGSALGFVWTLANPILLMLVYTFVFKIIFRMPASDVPFPAYLITGLLAWNFFSMAAIQASVTLVTGASLVNKSAFPRIVLPVSAVLANAVNYLVALPLLFVFVWVSGVKPTGSVILLPVALLLLIMMATGLGALLAALMPFFLDLQHLIEVCFTMWFFLTPVVYPISQVPDNWRHLYSLNPMVGITQLVHTVFLGLPMHDKSLVIAVLGSLGIFAIGLWIFSRMAVHCTEV